MKIIGFVPIKLNSRRLPNKNFLQIGGKPLAYHIFESMKKVKEIDSILCYTSQPHILKLLPKNIELLHRPQTLDGDEVKANELFEYAVNHIDADVVVLCHATAPFIRPESIKAGITAVINDGYDCAFSVSKHQTYVWYNDKPLNYDPANMAQTQNLKPIYLETSGFYIFRKYDYLRTNSRITGKPYFVEIDYKESIDIDYPDEFKLARHLYGYEPCAQDSDFDNFFVDIADLFKQTKSITHVSFDLDGVLIDSLKLMENAWFFAIKPFNLDISFDNYKKYIGLPFKRILEYLDIKEDYHTPIFERFNEFSSTHKDDIMINPHVIDQISRLKLNKIKVSVITSKTKVRTQELINLFFGANFFDLVVSPEDVPSGRGKPNPDPLLFACIQLGVDPSNTVYIGDMKPDRDCANRAGVHFVYANWGYGDLVTNKDIWFNSIIDFCDYLLS